MKQTMKKYFIFLASAAMLLATSCAKEEVNTTGETELITVQLNPETKTALGADGTTTWDADDKVSVTVGGEVVGTLSLVEGSTFSGEITAGLSGDATLNYPADVTAIPEPQVAVSGSFADGAALLKGTTTVEDLRAGKSVELKNKTALLKFTVAQAGEVTFEVGTAKYTVTGCKTGGTYYACVEPAEGVNLVARINGYLSIATSEAVTFTASTVADLEELPAPVQTKIYLKGGWNNWGTTTPLYEEGEYWYVVKNVNATNGEFKFHDTNTDKWMGKLSDFNLNNYCTTALGSGDNIPLAAQGTYDFYLNKEQTSIYVTNAGGVPPGVKRPVRLLIKNDGKTAMNLYVWYSENSKEVYPLGSWPGKAVTMTNKVTVCGTEYIYYEFDASYYGKTMNYIINWSNGQTGNVENVYWGQDNYYIF